ncbi:MAG: hypothetical protein HKN79_09600 [Flavobacteriales bacterium]|nr:hypothetical protein [Flavobacteriales bacterium]
MVNRPDIAEVMGVNAKDLHSAEEIQEFLQQHPYSHVLRLAHLDLLKKKGALEFDESLTEAAFHMPVRKILHELREEEENGLTIPHETLDDVPTAEETKEVEIESKSVGIRTPEDGRSNDTKEEKPADLDPKKQELELQYLAQAVESSILKEAEPEKEEPDVVAPRDEEEEVQKPKTVSVPKSFLDFISGEKVESPDPPLKNKDLIDGFLKGTERPKKEFFDASKMAKKSLDDSGGMVSDTLARIYVNQGNYAKAIDAYEQLILKYPEKSDYFAARIEKVKDLKRIKRK